MDVGGPRSRGIPRFGRGDPPGFPRSISTRSTRSIPTSPGSQDYALDDVFIPLSMSVVFVPQLVTFPIYSETTVKSINQAV